MLWVDCVCDCRVKWEELVVVNLLILRSVGKVGLFFCV